MKRKSRLTLLFLSSNFCVIHGSVLSLVAFSITKIHSDTQEILFVENQEACVKRFGHTRETDNRLLERSIKNSIRMQLFSAPNRRIKTDVPNQSSNVVHILKEANADDISCGFKDIQIAIKLMSCDMVSMLQALKVNHSSLTILGIVPCPSEEICLLLATSTDNMRPKPSDFDIGECKSSRQAASQLLADPHISDMRPTVYIVSGRPSPTLAAAAAAISLRYAYWHCTRPDPSKPASCAGLGGCHRRCWWRARRVPTVTIRTAALPRRAAAALAHRLAALGIPLSPPAPGPPDLDASIVALPGRAGYLTGLVPVV